MDESGRHKWACRPTITTTRIDGSSGQGNNNQGVRWPETRYIWSSQEVFVAILVTETYLITLYRVKVFKQEVGDGAPHVDSSEGVPFVELHRELRAGHL